MKTILFILMLCMAGTAMAQEPVQPYSRVQHPMSWYRTQASAWQQVVDKDPHNALAWYYLYYAQRILLYHEHTAGNSGQQQAGIDKLIAQMEQQVPGTYELNLVKWMAAGLDMKQLPYLQAAERLGKDRTEHLCHMMNVAEIQGDAEAKYAYARRLYAAGGVSAGMLYYNYNVLAGLDSNAILLTSGDNDTYPAWTLQALGIRRDVRVLNLSLMLDDTLRTRVWKQIGAAPLKMDWEVYATNPDKAEADFYAALPGVLGGNKKQYPFYISLTAAFISEKAKSGLEANLYLTGLAYRYSDAPLDNMAILKKNFEQVYALDYLDRQFYPEISAGLVSLINNNYIVPMIKLYDHYRMAGDVQRQQWIRQKLLQVSKGAQDEEKVKDHLAGR